MKRSSGRERPVLNVQRLPEAWIEFRAVNVTREILRVPLERVLMKDFN